MAMHSRNCIINNKSMTELEKKEALELYDQTELQFGKDMDTAQKAFDAIKYQKFLKKKNRLLTAQRTMENILRIEKFAENSTGKRYGHAVLSFVAPDARGVMNSFNLERRATAYRNEILAAMADFTIEYGKKGLTGGRGKGALGVHWKLDKADQYLLMQEASNFANGIGMTTGNKKMRALAEGYIKAMGNAVDKYNQLGGHMHKMQGWFMRQTHVKRKIMKVSEKEYLDDVLKNMPLDRENIISYKTGQPMSELELQLMAQKHYVEMTKDGRGSLAPKKFVESSNPSRSRIFKFKSFDDWYKYNEKYGESDIISSIFEHADKMGRDMAEVEILGPQPQTVLDNLIRYAEDAASKNKGSLKGLDKAQVFYDVFKRKHNETANEVWANLNTGLRGLATAAYLTNTIFSAINDSATAYNTARKVGMWGGRPVARHVGNILKLGLGRKELNAFLTRQGVVAEDSLFAAKAASKEAGDSLSGNGWIQILDDLVMRFQGLTQWTNAFRRSMVMETMAFFSENLGKSFDKLNPQFQTALRKYELDVYWDKITQATPETYKGSKFLTKDSLKDIDHELAMKYHEMLLSVMEDGVILSNIKATANALLGDAKSARGTLPREIKANLVQFKNFPIAVHIAHLYGQLFEDNVNTRMFGMNVSPLTARLYNTVTFIGLAVGISALSLQMRQIFFGKDPMDMTKPSFWREALFRSGGLGILEEPLRDPSAFGTTITLSGPVGNMLSDSADLAIEGYGALTGDPDNDLSTELYDYVKRYNIFGNLPYTKLAFQRLILQQMSENLDPGLRIRMDKREKRRYKKTGQQYWWEPFEAEPDRMPDWEAAKIDELVTEGLKFEE